MLSVLPARFCNAVDLCGGLKKSVENVHTEICVDIFRRKNESGKVGDDCEGALMAIQRGVMGTDGICDGIFLRRSTACWYPNYIPHLPDGVLRAHAL